MSGEETSIDGRPGREAQQVSAPEGGRLDDEDVAQIGEAGILRPGP